MGALAYMARRFVAGETADQAIEAVQRLNRRQVVASLDLLGEDVSTQAEAVAAKTAYLSLLDRIHELGVGSNVSLKLTQMGLDLGDTFCAGLVREVVAHAAARENFVRIDMEGSSYTERTIAIFREIFESHANVGVVLQAYLHRSENDARELAKIRAPIRVCKGAYKEPPAIAYADMDDIRRSYRTMVETLLSAGSRVGIATHDEQLIRWAIEWTRARGIPNSQFEFQFLYGLKRERGFELASAGYNVRSYVPFGTQWMPYFVRRLRERKENVFFVLKGLFEG